MGLGVVVVARKARMTRDGRVSDVRASVGSFSHLTIARVDGSVNNMTGLVGEEDEIARNGVVSAHALVALRLRISRAQDVSAEGIRVHPTSETRAIKS